MHFLLSQKYVREFYCPSIVLVALVLGPSTLSLFDIGHLLQYNTHIYSICCIYLRAILQMHGTCNYIIAVHTVYVLLQMYRYGHCSALIKPLPGFENIFASHSRLVSNYHFYAPSRNITLLSLIFSYLSFSLFTVGLHTHL